MKERMELIALHVFNISSLLVFTFFFTFEKKPYSFGFLKSTGHEWIHLMKKEKCIKGLS